MDFDAFLAKLKDANFSEIINLIVDFVKAILAGEFPEAGDIIGQL